MERAKVTAEDSLILGDYVDGWSQSQVLDYLIELNSTNNCVFIRGNHDELLLHWLKTAKTILCGTSMVAKQLYLLMKK
jgi:serine/threonine protein phosphatase 1